MGRANGSVHYPIFWAGPSLKKVAQNVLGPTHYQYFHLIFFLLKITIFLKKLSTNLK